MSFRARLLLAFLCLAVAPLVFFGLRARGEVTARLAEQHEARVAALADVIEEDLARESAAVAARLERLAQAMTADNRLRLALLDRTDPDRAYLLDYAARAMPLAGLDLLRVHDRDGRVLSSGHFRNEYDAVDPGLPEAIRRSGNGAVLVALPTPAGPRLGLARARRLEVGTRTLTLVGATAVDDRLLERLARGTGLEVRLEVPAAASAGRAAGTEPAAGTSFPTAEGAPEGGSGPRQARDVVVRLAGADRDTVARFVIQASSDPLDALRGRMDRWLLATLTAAAALALLLAIVVSGWVSRPLASLARRAERLDLGRLDVGFPTRRTDEIGALSRVLDRMIGRLRASAARLREAERRATIGDMARQVNHDLRNGLIPIRNVVRHLSELGRRQPDRLAAVFQERQRTLESSLEYLDALASSYARLSQRGERRPCDLNEIARQVVDDASNEARVMGETSQEARVVAELASDLPTVEADPVALRRILENLVVNAVEEVTDGDGRVVVWTRGEDGTAGGLAFGVTDTGRGMAPAERERIFEGFYTTKPDGSGLGLSIVRRLVSDLDGRIEVESEPGTGTRVTVRLPTTATTAARSTSQDGGRA